MWGLTVRLVALLTFTIGTAAVWGFHQPADIPGCFMVLMPPAPGPHQGQDELAPLPHSCGNLVVSVEESLSLELNESEAVGSIGHPGKMSARLSEIFRTRFKDRAYAPGMEFRLDLADDERILRTVTIKPRRSMTYGDVVKVVDAVKGAGAKPIILQIDDLPIR